MPVDLVMIRRNRRLRRCPGPIFQETGKMSHDAFRRLEELLAQWMRGPYRALLLPKGVKLVWPGGVRTLVETEG